MRNISQSADNPNDDIRAAIFVIGPLSRRSWVADTWNRLAKIETNSKTFDSNLRMDCSKKMMSMNMFDFACVN